MECFVLLCHVGEGPVPTALVYYAVVHVYIYEHMIVLLCHHRSVPMADFLMMNHNSLLYSHYLDYPLVLDVLFKGYCGILGYYSYYSYMYMYMFEFQ